MAAVEKDSLRSAIRDQRLALAPHTWEVEDRARTARLLQLLGGTAKTVALYASRAGEPGTTDAITTLHNAGWLVLLPTLSGRPGWAPFHGWDRMRPGWGGILEPLPPESVHLDRAEVVVVACLAVARDGTRLGTGGGWYDKALPLRRPGIPVWALARTSELCEELPREVHDVAVDAAVTQDGVFACGEDGMPDIGMAWPPELS